MILGTPTCINQRDSACVKADPCALATVFEVEVRELSDRSIGWLRYLDRKAHTPDDWSRDGEPHAHWDDRSDLPMSSWHRFDLVDSSYAMGLMAHRTPAWTERYVKILDQLIERHSSWWSASDWLNQFGPDPDRGDYLDSHRMLIPHELWGEYDAPGWTANGTEPYGVQIDPVAADGMLSYKGFFLVLLGIRAMIDPDDRWNEPFEMIREGAHTFTWTHSQIAERLCEQWLASPIGCHCENTKIWPSRLAGAGLGLRLHDNRHGTDYHARAFDPWWAYAREQYLDLVAETPPAETTLYYDPALDVHHRKPVASALTTSYYAAPQCPDDARRLFDAACASIGYASTDGPTNPLPASRAAGSALILAREWGLQELETWLVDAIEASYEPTWNDETGEFTWGMGLDEPHPRGQYNALLAAAEATGPGMWQQLSAAPLESCPQIVDVDFPTMALSRAEWIKGHLHLRLSPLYEDPKIFTSFRLVGGEPRVWNLTGVDGASMDVTMNGIFVRVPLVHADIVFEPGNY